MQSRTSLNKTFSCVHKYAGIFFSLLALILTGCSPSPPNTFLDLPVHLPFEKPSNLDISLGEFVKYGIKSEIEKKWKNIDDEKWSLEINQKDKITGQGKQIIFVFVEDKSASQVVLKRMLFNGKDGNFFEITSTFGLFKSGAIATKKEKGNS